MTTQTNEQKRERKTSSDSPQARSNKRRDKANTTNHGPRDPCLSTQRWCWLHSISTTMNPSNKRTGSHTNTPTTDATNPSNHFIFPSVDGATYYSAGGGGGGGTRRLLRSSASQQMRRKGETNMRKRGGGRRKGARENTQKWIAEIRQQTRYHIVSLLHTHHHVFSIFFFFIAIDHVRRQRVPFYSMPKPVDSIVIAINKYFCNSAFDL